MVGMLWPSGKFAGGPFANGFAARAPRGWPLADTAHSIGRLGTASVPPTPNTYKIYTTIAAMGPTGKYNPSVHRYMSRVGGRKLMIPLLVTIWRRRLKIENLK